MELNTKFYGPISYEENEVITFPTGLPGFEKYNKFLALEPVDSVFGSLQSIEEPGLAFVIISPYRICPDYSIHLSNEDVKLIQLNKPEEAQLLAVVSIRPNLSDSTVNLQAPLVINKIRRIGYQVLLPESGYPIRFPLWDKEAFANYQCSVNS